MLQKWWWWVLFFFSFFLIRDTSAFQFVFFIFFYTALLFGSTVIESLFATLLLSLPFDIDFQGATIEIIRARPDLDISYGYNIRFGMTMRLIIVIVLLLLLIGKTKHRQQLFQRASLPQFLLIGFVFLAFLSSIFANHMDKALLGFISLVEVCTLFFIGLGIFQTEKNRNMLQVAVIGAVIFFGTLGSLQLLLSRPLGLLVESRKDTFAEVQRGFLTSDGVISFRSPGTTSHATFFGAILTLLLPLVFCFGIEKITQPFFYTKPELLDALGISWAIVSGLIALYATKSRSAWLSFALCLFILILYNRQRILKIVRDQTRPLLFVGSIAGLIVVLFLFKNTELLTRLQSLEFYSQYGNGSGRAELMRHSFLMIAGAPLFGVGLHSFTPTMIAEGIRPGYGGFIYPVHNLFLLFFSELGIPAGLLFCFFCAHVLLFVPHLKNTSYVTLGTWLGLWTFILNAQVHTLFNQGASLYYFFLLSAFLLQERKSHENSPDHLSE